MRFILAKAVTRLEGLLGVELPYLRVMVEHAPGALMPVALSMPAGGYGRRVPTPVLHMVRLGATQAQDCGECLQIAVNMALRDSVDSEHMMDALSGRFGDLPREYADAFNFGALVGSGHDAQAARGAIRSRYSERGLIEASMAAAASQFFPVLKRGMGFAEACDLSRLDLELESQGVT